MASAESIQIKVDISVDALKEVAAKVGIRKALELNTAERHVLAGELLFAAHDLDQARRSGDPLKIQQATQWSERVRADFRQLSEEALRLERALDA